MLRLFSNEIQGIYIVNIVLPFTKDRDSALSKLMGPSGGAGQGAVGLGPASQGPGAPQQTNALALLQLQSLAALSALASGALGNLGNAGNAGGGMWLRFWHAPMFKYLKALSFDRTRSSLVTSLKKRLLFGGRSYKTSQTAVQDFSSVESVG